MVFPHHLPEAVQRVGEGALGRNVGPTLTTHRHLQTEHNCIDEIVEITHLLFFFRIQIKLK